VKPRTSTLTRADIRVDRRAHDRMREYHGIRPDDDLCVGQPVYSLDDKRLIERADLGQVTQPGLPTEHGQSACDAHRRGGEARNPGQHRACDARRALPGDA